MDNNVFYTDDLSWIEDPNSEIEKMIENYNNDQEEKRQKKFEIKRDDGTVEIVDFENDPDYAFLLEMQDTLFDPNGEYIFDKKIVKNWKYFNQKHDDYEFYIEKAKYILKNYWFYKQEIEYMKQGLPINPNPKSIGKELNLITADLKSIDNIMHLYENPNGGINGRSHRFYYISQKQE